MPHIVPLHRLYETIVDKRNASDDEDDIALLCTPSMEIESVVTDLIDAMPYGLDDDEHLSYGVRCLGFENNSENVVKIFVFPADYPSEHAENWSFEWLFLPSYLQASAFVHWGEAVSGLQDIRLYEASALEQVAASWGQPVAPTLPAIRLSDESLRESVLHDGYCPTCYTTWYVGMGATIYDWLFRCSTCTTPTDVPHRIDIQRQPATSQQQREVDTLRRLVERSHLDFPDLSSLPGGDA